MAGSRAIFMSEHIGGHQYRLRIRDNHPADNLQWFSYDTRTNSIRALTRKTFSLSTQRGTGFRNGNAAVMRQFKNENENRIKWFSGSRKNLRNNGGRCLDVHGGHNHENRHIHWWNCHNGLNQAWRID
jgi:hypothetical protein